MNIKIKKKEKRAIVSLSGHIDIPAAEILKKKLFQISGNDAKEITLDFHDVNSIGSSGIGAIIFFYKQFSPLGGEIKIINVNKEIGSLFKIIQLDNLFEIKESGT